jgi:TolB protein
VDGTERLQLTPPAMYVYQPQWSPNGKRIAFAGAMPGKRSRIYIVSEDGGTLEEVTHGENDEALPSWSQDGNVLFFGNLLADVGLAPPTAFSQLNLTNHQVTTISGSERLRYPRLSPDDRYIAALTSMDHLALFDLKTDKWMELTTTKARFPSWSHDGKYVYFSSNAGGEPAFYRVQIKDHKLERVASLKDVRRPNGNHSELGSWTGLTFDDSPLALRDINTFEIYALDWQLP